MPLDVVRDADALNTFFDGQKLFRRSLFTKDLGQVHASAEAQRRDFEKRLRGARKQENSAAAAVPTAQADPSRLTKLMLEAISKQHRWLTFRPWRDAYLAAENGGEWADELDRMCAEREMDAETTKAALLTPGFVSNDMAIDTPAARAEVEISSRNILAPVGSKERALILTAIRRGMIAGNEDIDKLLAGQPTDASPPGQRTATVETPTLSEAVESYIASKALRPKTVAEIRSSMRIFSEIVGDKHLSELTRSDFRGFVADLARRVVGGRAPGSIERTTASQTIKKRLSFLRSAIAHAIEVGDLEIENEAIGVSVTSAVKKPDRSVMPAKRPFTVSELNRIFQHPWFAGCASSQRTHQPGSHHLNDSHYWAPVVALFSGCRAGELGGLKLSEVRLDDPCPHFHIRDNEYRPTKGGYARDVPILDALLELGFAEYVKRIASSGSDRLFPDWQPKNRNGFNKDDAAWSNARLLRSFNRTVVTNTLASDMNPGARREVTFHSFRGAFKSMLGLARHRLPVNIIHEVIGHAKIDLDKRYVGAIPLEETYPVVRSCTYPALVIPSRRAAPGG